MMAQEDEGFDRNFMKAASVFAEMETALMWIGMGSNKNFEALRRDMLKHCGDTYNDITKNG